MGSIFALAIGLAIGISATAQEPVSPHLDPDHGVLRIVGPTTPVGSCGQCHDEHALITGESRFAYALFAESSNNLCYTPGGAGPCHQMTPTNYPATESDRIPDGFADAGYFEHNSGGQKIRGADFRSRWPGQIAYDNPGVVGGLHYFSPHRNDPDMPVLDPSGAGSCLACHNVHGSENPFDMLLEPYRGTSGAAEATYPSAYSACLACHSTFGPAGMDSENRRIADYYDSSINGETAGHQIRFNPQIALSWPSNVSVGDKLACYDCHGAHGSLGHNNQGPNLFLISDQRPGWSNLTNTLNDPQQSRAFCLGCHISSDGIPGSRTVAGIVMNTLSDGEEDHGSFATRGCHDCHGKSYGSSTSKNVHNPKGFRPGDPTHYPDPTEEP